LSTWLEFPTAFFPRVKGSPWLTRIGTPYNQDAYLPVAHTCYFSLELPCYSSAEVMRRRLEYAMTEGVAIDLDHTVAATAAAWAVSDDEPELDY